MADNALNIYTYQDAVDLLVDYLGGNAEAAAARDVRKAVREAYDELCGERMWSHFSRTHYLHSETAVEGTFAYDATTNLFTIDSGTWPTWAAGATLSYGDVRFRITTRNSSTTLTPHESTTPVDDIATGASFTMYKDILTLPETFMSLVRPMDESNDSTKVQYIPPEEWAYYTRYDESQGQALLWTIMADPIYLGRQAVHLWPAPDTRRTIAFLGRFYPRSLLRTGYRSGERVGTVSLSGNTITGTNTAFTSDMVGSVIRISENGTVAPDGIGGDNPYQYQRIITSYSSATSMDFGGDAVSASTRKYTISDPIDVSRSMIDAFWRGCERRVSNKKGTAAMQVAERDYMIALSKAKSSDSNIPSGVMSCWDAKPQSARWVQGGDDF